MSKKELKKEGSLEKNEYQALSEFRYAIRKFLKFSEAAAKKVGLTSQQHQALLAIKGFAEREVLTNGELAERLQIKHHSAVGLVNRLEAQGLVIRKPGNNDKREVYLALTKSGEKLLEQLAAVHRKELKHIAPQLSDILESLKQAE
jgi:DNA-binding MarR family transcriptional regulator